MPKADATSPSSPSPRRTASLTTVSIASFSLTLLAGGVLVLAGMIPLPQLSAAERLDVGTLLLVAPLMALALALAVEVARMALTVRDLPEPRRQRTLRWAPGRREG
jgi:hypothetical protein